MSRALARILKQPTHSPRRVRMPTPDAAVKAVIAADAERIGVQGRPRYPEVSNDRLGRTLSRNELVYACVGVLGDSVAEPMLKVERRDGSSETYAPLLDHPLHRLLMRPNEHMDTAQFFRAYVVSRFIYGRFFAEKLYSPAGAIIGLNPLDPRKMKYKTDTNEAGHTVITAWEWKDGGQTVTFKVEDLLIWEPLDWVEPPAAAVALGSVDSDDAQTDYVRAFFNNAGVPSGLLTVDRQLDQPKVDRIKSNWRAAYGRSSGKQHDLAVLDKGAVYQRIGANLDELQSETVRSVTESRICMAFRVPPLIIYSYSGLLRATYANLPAAYRGFWDLRMRPLLKDIASWLAMTLLESFEGRERVLSGQVRLRWDLSDVAALQEDEDAKHVRANRDLMSGGILINEYREQVGLDPDPEGNYYLRRMGFVAVPWETPADAQNAPAPAALDAPAPGATASRRKARILSRALKAVTVEELSDEIEGEIAAYLAAEYRKAVQAVRQGAE